MLVLQSTLARAKRVAQFWEMRYNALKTEHNALVTRINRLGGESFLQRESSFTESELRQLLRLVHPDKHGGKKSAVRLTQKILTLRK